MNRFVRNTVVKGFGRGSRELGCPTANVDGANSIDMPTGIYCGLAQLVIREKKEMQPDTVMQNLPYVSPVRGMVCSFGFNPHYGNSDKSLEVHILEQFNFDFYGAELRVLICKKMRDEEKYNSLDELKQAIANDIANATSEVPNYIHHARDSRYFLEPTINNCLS